MNTTRSLKPYRAVLEYAATEIDIANGHGRHTVEHAGTDLLFRVEPEKGGGPPVTFGYNIERDRAFTLTNTPEGRQYRGTLTNALDRALAAE